MRKILYASLLLVAVLGACDERVPAAFDEINGIYFNNRANISSTSALLDSVSRTFVYENTDEMEVTVKVQLLGRPSSQARPIEMRVTSEDAIEGVDYTLPDKAEIPADATSLNYIVVLKRTPELKEKSKTIALEILPNEYFSLPVPEEVQANGDTISTSHFRIVYSDMFVSPPAAWEENLIGDFSQQKFELICKVLHIAPSDFNDATKITFSMQLFIYSEMTQYVDQEIAKRNRGEEFDKDVLDAKTGEPLSFRKTSNN